MHHLEIGKLEPSIELARKLERLLKINLIETIEVEQEKTKQEKSDVLTIGDILKTE